jgi:putative DNA primase/helicase
LTPLKNNIGDDRTGFAFAVESAFLPDGIATSCIQFDATPVTVDANDLLRSNALPADDEGGALAEAIAFLRAELADGAKPAKRCQAAAREAGISESTLRRARERTCSVRKGAFGWSWELRSDGSR